MAVGPSKVKVGDVVHVVFWDHAQDSDDALRFEIFGRVRKITRKAIIVGYWLYCSEIDRVSDDNKWENEDCYAIVKTAVESVRVLE